MLADTSVGIMTGDMKFCPDAQVIVMTTEILRNLLYKRGTATEHLGLTASLSLDNVDAVIFDECHYINDRDRGKVWEETMILLPPSIRMIMLSATLDDPEKLATWLTSIKQHPVHLIQTQYRIVPLTHHVLNEEKMIPIMDAKERYDEQAYAKWYRAQYAAQADERAYQRQVADAKRQGVRGGIEGKHHVADFVFRLNEVAALLEKKELLPALFFVLSRKQCESYAAKVEKPLLDSSDTAAVKHIITFHLHRYMEDLQKVPQYHQIYDLLCRGVAFHHSGLLPILKEIIEILFTKGYVKLLFCTETFAVGMNMPTKTVLFAGFKKYDDLTGKMRMLRTDEYMQMAGRAGRRGKDDKGIVLYVPDRDPVHPDEMYAMMCGARPPVESRMDFHYDFFLKTLQASPPNEPMVWLQRMKDSYWFRQHNQHLEKRKAELITITQQLDAARLDDVYHKGCAQRIALENAHKAAVNAEKKELQRQLDTIKNKQLGPKWKEADTKYRAFLQLEKECIDRNMEIAELEQACTMDPVIEFLFQMGYLEHNDPSRLTVENLGLKGILATEVNEGHPILMTELYQEGMALTGTELVCVLACFQEKKKDAVTSSHLAVSSPTRAAIQRLQQIAKECEALDHRVGYPLEGYWEISMNLVEPMQKWMEGAHASVICAEYEIFEGNFIRAVMKVANMLDEWLAMATYCQHTDQITKVTETRTQLLRDLLMADSLYLRL